MSTTTNPTEDESLPGKLRNALRAANVTTRDELATLVKSGRLLHLPGIGRTCFRAAETWLARNDPSIVKLPLPDFWFFAVATLRYSFGRRTMMPSFVQSQIIEHARALSPRQREQIVEEVEEQLEIEAKHRGTLGEDSDVNGWAAFAKLLRAINVEMTTPAPQRISDRRVGY